MFSLEAVLAAICILGYVSVLTILLVIIGFALTKKTRPRKEPSNRRRGADESAV